jgi:superfamily II DNA/RNA helicase
MPTFGKSNARAPKKAAAGRKPRTSSADKAAAKAGFPKGAGNGRAGSNFKPREDGRGGRSEFRASSADAPRAPRAKGAFFEARAPKTYGSRDERPSYARDDRAPKSRDNGFSGNERGNTQDRGGRPSYGNRDDRAPREDRGGYQGRSERPAYNRDDRAPRGDRPTYGNRDNAGRPERSNDGRRDWSPRGNEGSGRPAKKAWGSRDDRDARPSYGNRDDRAPREDRGARDSRPSYGNRDADRAPRTFGSREERPARSGFGGGFGDRNRAERPSYGKSDSSRFEDRTSKRGWSEDRGRDSGRDSSREERNPNRPDRAARDDSRESSFRGARDSNPNKKAFFEDKVLERLDAVEASEAITTETFAEMGLHPRILEALTGMGAAAPFPIQASTIPAAISGRDVLGRGKTGSGKTIAFTVPLVMKLVAAGSVPRKPGKPRALILAPTRELADQIDRTVNGIARAVGFYTTCIYGGVPQRKQENAMSRGVDIVVATPGRLEDLISQRIIDLSEVETLVVDEADHMCDLGFIEGVRRIMRATGDSQKLLFSATLDREVDALVKEFLPDPYVYEVPNEENDTANIIHRVMTVDPEDRSQVLLRLVQGHGKSIIFTRTKMTAERLSESLTAAGVPAARLHGDLNQNQRNRNLERFTKGGCRVLVATDVAARGIHVDDVAFVIQVDPPEEYKTYLHRSGRTGRANKEGTVITLIPRSRRRRMEDLLRRAERDGIFSEVRPASELLVELAGPIAPIPAPESLDFGDSRGGSSREGGRGRSGGDRGGRSGGGRGNYGGSGKGRWADKPKGEGRPRAKKYAN